MRTLQANGATIALHGYRHLCTSRGRSLVPLHRQSEFAGVAEPTQRQWIHLGLEILRSHGINASIWIAPRHGFDRATLRALRSEGIGLLCDGFTLRPFLRGGIVWLPQQLWEPVAKYYGLWTICIHSNTATDAQFAHVREFISRHRSQFTTVERAVSELGSDPLTLREQFAQTTSILSIRIRQSMKKTLGRP
jgi:predicted deacetylase